MTSTSALRIDSAPWQIGANTAITGGTTVTIGDASHTGSMWVDSGYVLDEFYFRCVCPVGWQLSILALVGPSYSAGGILFIDRYAGANTISYSWDGPGYTFSYGQGYNASSMAWLRISKVSYSGRSLIEFSASPDGTIWTPLTDPTLDDPSMNYDLSDVEITINSGGGAVATQMDAFSSTTPIGPASTDDPLDSPPYDITDGPYVPADVPVATAGCATLLELIQQFSGQVRRAVRITGPRRIRMVDVAAPLPDGWTQADAPDLYHTSTRGLATSAPTFSHLVVRANKLALTSSAEFVTDDIRVITSDYRIPDRLPVPFLHPAPVMRVTYTFGTEHFSASVEFAHHKVPLGALRP